MKELDNHLVTTIVITDSGENHQQVLENGWVRGS